MKLYNEGVEWVTIPDARKKKGAFFDRLVGINVSKNKERILVEPIYQAAIKFEMIGENVWLTLAWDKPFLVIVFMPHWPFANVFRPDGYQLEEAE